MDKNLLVMHLNCNTKENINFKITKLIVCSSSNNASFEDFPKQNSSTAASRLLYQHRRHFATPLFLSYKS